MGKEGTAAAFTMLRWSWFGRHGKSCGGGQVGKGTAVVRGVERADPIAIRCDRNQSGIAEGRGGRRTDGGELRAGRALTALHLVTGDGNVVHGSGPGKIDLLGENRSDRKAAGRGRRSGIRRAVGVIAGCKRKRTKSDEKCDAGRNRKSKTEKLAADASQQVPLDAGRRNKGAKPGFAPASILMRFSEIAVRQRGKLL